MDKILAEQSVVGNRYRIVRLIGCGGMGAVYEAIDSRLQTTVALKQCIPIEKVARQAFEREAHFLAHLQHPGLPVVNDHFLDGEDQFLVMGFVPGPNLHELLTQRGSALSETELLALADQILEILEYLHTRTPPIIHRDIKPQNMKLSATTGRVMLLDFGLAKSYATASTATAGAVSVFGYSHGYASPEQINGTGTDERSDIFSLSATLYNLATGSAPLPTGQRIYTTGVERKADPLQAANLVNPHLSREVSALLSTGMALDPTYRHPTATAMRRALRATPAGQRVAQATLAQPVAAATAVLSPPPSTVPLATPLPPPAPTGFFRNKAVVFGGIAIALIGLFALIGFGIAGFTSGGGGGGASPASGAAASPSAMAPGATRTPRPTRTPEPTDTPSPPTDTSIPPTYTPQPTDTPLPPTHTPLPSATSTSAPVPPTTRPPTPRPPTPRPPARPTNPPSDVPTIAGPGNDVPTIASGG